MNLNSNSQSVMLTKETLELHQLQQLSQPQNTTRLYTSQFNQRNDSNSQSHIHAVVKQYRPKRSRNGMSPDSPSLPIEKQISKDDTSESQDQSETDHRIDPVLQLTSRVIRQTTARKRTRFDKAPLVDERVKGELSATLVPPPPLHTVLKRTVDLNLQSIHVKNSVENTLKKLYQIKMNEIDVEAKLLQQGDLPEYHKQLAIIEKNIVQKLSFLKCLHSNEVLSHERLYEETFECANDTWNSKSRETKQNLMNHKSTQKWKLIEEMLDMKKYPNVANNEFIISSTTIKRKREEAYITENVNHDDASDRVKFLPEWTQSLLKIHAQSGDKSLIVPPFFTELREDEKDEDIAFIRMCRS